MRILLFILMLSTSLSAMQPKRQVRFAKPEGSLVAALWAAFEEKPKVSPPSSASTSRTKGSLGKRIRGLIKVFEKESPVLEEPESSEEWPSEPSEYRLDFPVLPSEEAGSGSFRSNMSSMEKVVIEPSLKKLLMGGNGFDDVECLLKKPKSKLSRVSSDASVLSVEERKPNRDRISRRIGKSPKVSEESSEVPEESPEESREYHMQMCKYGLIEAWRNQDSAIHPVGKTDDFAQIVNTVFGAIGYRSIRPELILQLLNKDSLDKHTLEAIRRCLAEAESLRRESLKPVWDRMAELEEAYPVEETKKRTKNRKTRGKVKSKHKKTKGKKPARNRSESAPAKVKKAKVKKKQKR